VEHVRGYGHRSQCGQQELVTMTHHTLTAQEPATPVRGAWGLSVRDDGRVAVTYAGQLVATTAYCTSEDQARVHTLYAALVRRGAR